MSRGEEWDFDRYRSTNEIWIGEKRVARDVMLLENPAVQECQFGPFSDQRPLRNRLAPYACYAAVFLFGPTIQPLSNKLRVAYESISQMQRNEPPTLIWSLSEIGGDNGIILRVAATTTEGVKDWLKVSFQDLGSVVGRDAYDKAFV
jgi:urease accessory protein